MSENRLNQSENVNPSRSLHKRLSIIGWLGWLAFALQSVVFAVVVIVLANKAAPILAVDDRGNVQGTVVLNDAEIRDESLAVSDLKRWVTAAKSLNSATIWEDAQITINHMCPELQQIKADEWQETGSLSEIAGLKSVSTVEFSDGYPNLIRNRDRFESEVRGRVYTGVVSEPVSFHFLIKGKFIQRTEERPLGIEVCHDESI